MIGDILAALFIWYVVLPWAGVALLWLAASVAWLVLPDTQPNGRH
jgi:hypothetical protein